MPDGKKKPLQLQVPRAQYEYLTYLAKNSFVGARETEIAGHILTTAITKMIVEKFHELPFPRDSGSTEDNCE